MHVGADRWLDLELVEARDIGGRETAGGRLDCYALTFRGRDRGHVPQATYRLESPDLGDLEVFLVPIGPDAVGMRYEAIFN